MELTLEHFKADRHAAGYVPELDAHPAATAELLALLSDPENEQRLRHASEMRVPALRGIVEPIANDAAIAAVLSKGAAANRFRQAVGVAVRLKMEQLGWATTGRKGPIPSSAFFTKAERYEPRTG